MKFFALLFLFLFTIHFSTAQIEVDTAYTVMVKGHETEDAMAFILADFYSMMIKQNASGKTCRPTSMEWTFMIDAITYKTTKHEEAKELVLRAKPKDAIYIENIKLPASCFPPPSQILIRVK